MKNVSGSVPDPDSLFIGLLNPDPFVRGMDPAPSIIFYHQAKIVRKTLIPNLTSFEHVILEK
jgi:hypothetical protein